MIKYKCEIFPCCHFLVSHYTYTFLVGMRPLTPLSGTFESDFNFRIVPESGFPVLHYTREFP